MTVHVQHSEHTQDILSVVHVLQVWIEDDVGNEMNRQVWPCLSTGKIDQPVRTDLNQS